MARYKRNKAAKERVRRPEALCVYRALLYYDSCNRQKKANREQQVLVWRDPLYLFHRHSNRHRHYRERPTTAAHTMKKGIPAISYVANIPKYSTEKQFTFYAFSS